MDKKIIVDAITFLIEEKYLKEEDIHLLLERKLIVDDLREIATRKFYGSDVKIYKKRLLEKNS